MSLPIPLLLMLTSVSATLEVLVMVAAGMVLLYMKVIQESHVRVLSVLVFQLFTPCMLAYKFASSVDITLLKTSYLAIVFAFLYITAASLLARLIFSRWIWGARLAGVRKVVVLVAVTFNNAGSLPYVFVAALVSTGNIFTEKKLASDQAIAFISLYLLPVQMLFWSVGMAMMRRKEEEKEESNNDDDDDGITVDRREDSDHVEQVDETVIGHDIASSIDDVEQQDDALPFIDETTTMNSHRSNDDDDNDNDEHQVQIELDLVSEQQHEREREQHITVVSDNNNNNNDSHRGPLNHHLVNRITSYIKRRCNAFYRNLPPFKQVVTPPIYGSLAGILVSIIPYAKQYLIDDPPVIVASLSHICETFGGAVFPLSMILLGANLASTIQSTSGDQQKGATGVGGEEGDSIVSGHGSRAGQLLKRVIKHNDPWVVLAAVVTRLIVMPLVGIGFTLLFTYFGVLPRNPVLMLVLMIEASTPTAINTSILCTLNGNHGIYHMCELLLFMYLSSPITLSLLSTAYLYLSCHFSPDACNL